MPFKMGDTSFVLCIFLIVSFGNLSFGLDPDQVNARLAQLEGRVNALENEVRRLKETENCNDVINVDDGGMEEGVNTNVEISEDTEIKVLEVRREVLPEGIMFSVRYWSDGKHPITIHWYNGQTSEKLTSEEVEVDANHESGPGVSESRVITQSRDGSVGVSIRATSSWAYLEMRNNGTVDQVQTDIPDPVLKVTPLGDVVYEPGKDVEVTIEKPKGDSHGSFNAKFFLIDPNTGLLNISLDPPQQFIQPLGNETEFLDKTVIDVILKTSEYPTRGALVLTAAQFVDDEEDESSLAAFVVKSRVIGLRAINQAHPLPEGFLQVSGEGFFSTKENGVFTRYCESGTHPYGSSCFLGCHGVGADISGLTLYKVLPGGGREEIESETSSVGEYILYVQATPKSDKSDETQNFYCEAVDKQNGRVVREDYVVKFYTQVRISNNESGVFLLNETAVEVKCVVESTEKPTVEISVDIRYYYSTPNVTVKEDEGKYVATALINGEHDMQQNFRSASCNARDKTTLSHLPDYYNEDYHYMSEISETSN